MAVTLGLQFPCKYSSNECDVTSLLTDIPKQQTECEFVPYRCPDVYEDCQWSGSREEVAQHSMSEHEYRIKEPSFKYWQIELNGDIMKNWGIILSYKNQNFICIMKFDSKRKYHFKAIVLFIGEQRIADQFKYKIESTNRSNGTRLEWEDKPISIRRDVKSLLLFKNNYKI